MIEKIVLYVAYCDQCRGMLPTASENEHELWRLALADGWKSCGIELFCPECSRDAEGSDR